MSFEKSESFYQQNGLKRLPEELFREVTTHPSVSHDFNYQRLEFLGDSVFGLAVTSVLMTRFPERSEGELSILRRKLIAKEFMAKDCFEFGLKPFLKTAPKTPLGGKKILSCLYEAFWGAYFLQFGFKESLEAIEKRVSLYFSSSEKEELFQADSKTQLQEYGVVHFKNRPLYELISQSDTFRVKLTLCGKEEFGTGRTKLEAEQSAAKKMLNNKEQLSANNSSKPF